MWFEMTLVDGQQDSEDELDRRTNEFLCFVMDRGLVDLYVDEDGKLAFSPRWSRNTEGTPTACFECPHHDDGG